MDHFSLISDILLNRSYVVKEYKLLVSGSGGSKTLTGEEIRSKLHFVLFSFFLSRINCAFLNFLVKFNRKQPKSFGQQIVIQSEQEKRLAKELRKEDKRMNRLMEKRQDVAAAVASQYVDVDVLRRK